MSIIEINRAAARLAGIDAQLEWAVRRLIGALYQWLQWKNAAAAHIHGQCVEGGVNLGRLGEASFALPFGDRIGDLHDFRASRLMGYFLPSPEVVPIAI